MKLRRLASLTAGFGLLALSIGWLITAVSLLLAGPAVDTLAGAGILVLLGNLTFVSAFAGLYLLDAPTNRKTIGVRNLTLAGWGLIAITANVMAGVLILTSYFFPEYTTLLVSGTTVRFAPPVLIGLPVFLAGWFLLSRFGCRVWRKNDSSDTPSG